MESFDKAALLRRVNQNFEFLRRLVSAFQAEAPAVQRDLQAAVRAKNCELVADTAHELRGMLAMFSATPAQEACRQLEVQARAQQSARLEELLTLLSEACQEFERQLQALLAASEGEARQNGKEQ